MLFWHLIWHFSSKEVFFFGVFQMLMCYVLANAIGVMYYVYILICFVVVPILASGMSSSYTTKFT